jgi:hypothetical protein
VAWAGNVTVPLLLSAFCRKTAFRLLPMPNTRHGELPRGIRQMFKYLLIGIILGFSARYLYDVHMSPWESLESEMGKTALTLLFAIISISLLLAFA